MDALGWCVKQGVCDPRREMALVRSTNRPNSPSDCVGGVVVGSERVVVGSS
jgi:hypothetical protein